MLVVKGLQAVTASFLEAAESAEDNALSATKRAARQIKEAQQSEVPVASGETRKSVRYNTSYSKKGVRASIGATHYVARFLQFGTVNMGAKMDLYAASQPGIDAWMDDMERSAEVR